MQTTQMTMLPNTSCWPYHWTFGWNSIPWRPGQICQGGMATPCCPVASEYRWPSKKLRPCSWWPHPVEMQGLPVHHSIGTTPEQNENPVKKGHQFKGVENRSEISFKALSFRHISATIVKIFQASNHFWSTMKYINLNAEICHSCSWLLVQVLLPQDAVDTPHSSNRCS